MLLILTSSLTNRLRYIASLLLADLLGVEFSFTSGVEEYLAYEGPKISYIRQPPAGSPFIEPAGLLFETVIYPHELSVHFRDGIPVLFESTDPRSALSFDPFAASFYLVSRYEEYHAHKKDKYGRFLVMESIAHQNNFLHLPVVNLWAEVLGNFLQRHYPGFVLRRPAFRFVPTIDIDHAFAYRYRPLTRTLGGLGRSFLHGHFRDAVQRICVLAGNTKDPYDNYSFIREVHEMHGLNPLYFILFADYGGDDNNIPVGNHSFHKLLRELDRHKGVGIHPSLSSNKHYLKLEAEYSGLCEVLHRDIRFSRQHFLKIALPKTYRSLIQLGITDDFSMGYASHSGFRAGIAVPFPFFDLSRNEATTLKIHPVTLMDVTFKDYLRLTPEKSLEMIRENVNTIKSVNGEFVSLWHNESLSDTGRWHGWRKVYKEMLRIALA